MEEENIRSHVLGGNERNPIGTGTRHLSLIRDTTVLSTPQPLALHSRYTTTVILTLSQIGPTSQTRRHYNSKKAYQIEGSPLPQDDHTSPIML